MNRIFRTSSRSTSGRRRLGLPALAASAALAAGVAAGALTPAATAAPVPQSRM
ncbi:MAG: hypothetical protein JF597_42975 [Streptomyces sp.]|jgi:hypothetical protein|uniref:hypothetical protein n=1 Tax=Streptomyces sp. TaxID=1931 RepID=UPI0025F5042F|nr:hypothetical protein [Streptomyces sp.]MBW8800112.1 hypothetical protein [Streptomyces sp.]